MGFRSSIQRRHPIRSGFTLIEILIVVVILGILASIVIPQFASATQDAQVSSVLSTLRIVRGQVELYRAHNSGAIPNLTGTGTSAFGPLITTSSSSDEYMRSRPINPRTQTSDVVAAVNPPTTAAVPGGPAWFYDVTTGSFWAAGFNEAIANSGNPTLSPWIP